VAQARAEAPWGAAIPQPIFERYVAAPVSLGEPDRTPARTRAELRALVQPLVAGASDPADPGAVAVAINDGLWRAASIGFSHDPGPDPDPPPLESIASRTVSCVSASILLVAACRSVAVPARVVGIPAWAPAADPAKSVRGYHQWVEVWAGSWRHLGAYDRGALDRGWYADRAAATDASRPRHRIFAAASVVSPSHFPLPWARFDRTVPGRDVTAFYTRRREVRIELPEEAADLVAELVHDGEIVAAATAARPSVALAAGERYRWRLVEPGGRERAAGEIRLDPGATTLALP
jgi:transglutaminase-like putative cysteine protease